MPSSRVRKKPEHYVAETCTQLSRQLRQAEKEEQQARRAFVVLVCGRVLFGGGGCGGGGRVGAVSRGGLESYRMGVAAQERRRSWRMVSLADGRLRCILIEKATHAKTWLWLREWEARRDAMHEQVLLLTHSLTYFKYGAAYLLLTELRT